MELQRTILVNDQVSINLKLTKEVDLNEARTEAELINRITKAVEGMTKKAPTLRMKRDNYIRLSKEEEKQLLADYKKKPVTEVMEKYGFATKKALVNKIHYVRGKHGIKKVKQ